jgi:hypothetical protein
MTKRLLASLLFASLYLAAQTNSGTILGTVRDAQEAVLVGAAVTVTNVATGVSKTTPVTQTGQYTVPFLVPGPYSVTAEAPGFKKSTRTGITLRVADQLVIDMKLEVGAVAEQVTVNATAPILESASVTLGQVIETRRIVDLPLNGRDPLSLAQLAPGVAPNFSPLTAAQGGNIPSINGANFSTSAVTIDGATDVNPRATTELLIFTPNVDSVAEFKVETNSMSAEYGRTNGGSISLVTKSGTNQPHGTAYWFVRNSVFDANDFFSNRAGLPLGALRRNQLGATFGGPLEIPKVYNGKDKTFFFVDYEAFRERVAAPTSMTVPTAAQRIGDFSKTVNAAGQLVTIYDPFSTPTVNGAIVRTPFADNIIPQNRIDKVAANIVKFYPLPITNAINGNLPLNPTIPNTNNTFNLRLDQYAGAHHLYLRASYQQPEIGQAYYWGNIGTPTNPPLEQRRRSGALQDVYTISPSLILNMNYAILYMYGHRTAWSDGYDITQLGFPANYRDGQEVRAIPVTSITNFTGIGNGAQNYSTQMSHTFEASITKLFSRHRLKAGGDYRAYYNNQLQNSSAEGTLSFTPTFTQGANPNQASATAGNSMATFLLGLAGGSIINQPANSFRSAYESLFAQDDITLTRNLTMFVGMRWEVYQPRTERFDRMSVLDLSQPSPIAGQAPGLNLKGVMLFRGSDHRRLIDTQAKNFGPRIGLAWRAPGNMVVRAAYGIFYGLSSADATLTTAFADGFSATTSIVSSLDGVNPFVTLSNPYPNGINPPLSKGQLTPSLGIGQSTNSALLSLATPYLQQWNFTVQKSLSSTILLEAAYVANKGTRVSVNNMQLNTLTAAQMALGTATQQLVPNPFFGVIKDPTSALSGPQVARRVTMLPYPQYTGVASESPSLGNSIYHSLQARMEKRFAHGFTLLASYTLGKNLTNATGASIQDPNNLKAERGLANFDVSQRLVFSGVLELPVGRGKHLGTNWQKPVDLILGGWQFNAIAAFQKGLPLALSSTGAARPNEVHPLQPIEGPMQSRLGQYFDTTAFAIPAAFTYGNAPPTIPDLRSPGINNFDLSLFKNFRIVERLTAQLRFEAFNAFNRVQFGSPGLQNGTASFGIITSQLNTPRKLQIAMKLIF